MSKRLKIVETSAMPKKGILKRNSSMDADEETCLTCKSLNEKYNKMKTEKDIDTAQLADVAKFLGFDIGGDKNRVKFSVLSQKIIQSKMEADNRLKNFQTEKMKILERIDVIENEKMKLKEKCELETKMRRELEDKYSKMDENMSKLFSEQTKLNENLKKVISERDILERALLTEKEKVKKYTAEIEFLNSKMTNIDGNLIAGLDDLIKNQHDFIELVKTSIDKRQNLSKTSQIFGQNLSKPIPKFNSSLSRPIEDRSDDQEIQCIFNTNKKSVPAVSTPGKNTNTYRLIPFETKSSESAAIPAYDHDLHSRSSNVDPLLRSMTSVKDPRLIIRTGNDNSRLRSRSSSMSFSDRSPASSTPTPNAESMRKFFLSNTKSSMGNIESSTKICSSTSVSGEKLTMKERYEKLMKGRVESCRNN